jgi:hypothetical protein
MNAEALIDRLEAFAAALPTVVGGVGPDDARWRPEGGGWSILEIVRHLVDEETDDFRPRLDSTLTDPTADWAPIDPEGAAAERRYNEGDLASAVEAFVRERAASIRMLRGLEDPSWDFARVHPILGTIRAGDLLASWCGHDALHLRQIAKRLFQLATRDAGPFSVGYAGAWTA